MPGVVARNPDNPTELQEESSWSGRAQSALSPDRIFQIPRATIRPAVGSIRCWGEEGPWPKLGRTAVKARPRLAATSIPPNRTAPRPKKVFFWRRRQLSVRLSAPCRMLRISFMAGIAGVLPYPSSPAIIHGKEAGRLPPHSKCKASTGLVRADFIV